MNSGSVYTGLSAPAIYEVNEVDAVGVDDGERPGATLERRTYIGRMVAELEDVTGVPESGFFKVRTIPLLRPVTCQDNVDIHIVTVDLPLMCGRG